MKAPRSNTVEFEKHPTGWARLVCTRIIDKGTVFNEAKQKDQHKISIYFESEKLMSEGDFAGQPFLVIANYNFSMYQNSHLCSFIEQWEGRKFPNQDAADDFDFAPLLRKPAYANITHSDDGKWVNIGAIGPMPDGVEPLKPVGDVYFFDLDNADMKVFEKLSDKVKAGIQSSHEWQSNKGEAVTKHHDEKNPPPADFDDDIPF